MEPNKENIYICRCEEITVADVERAIAAGARTLTAVKVRTNAGMGICQGMTCRKNIEKMLREKAVGEGCPCHSPYRFPVRTVTAGALEKEFEEQGGGTV
ncbi:MAG: (2Fe-2S)-binding protein [Oscillospiraceae bacterium]